MVAVQAFIFLVEMVPCSSETLILAGGLLHRNLELTQVDLAAGSPVAQVMTCWTR